MKAGGVTTLLWLPSRSKVRNSSAPVQIERNHRTARGQELTRRRIQTGGNLGIQRAERLPELGFLPLMPIRMPAMARPFGCASDPD